MSDSATDGPMPDKPPRDDDINMLARSRSRASAVEKEDWAAGQNQTDPAVLHDPEMQSTDPEDQYTTSDDDDEDANNQPQTVVSRVLSRMTSKSSIDPGPPPDGGARAWAQCLAAHLIIFNTWYARPQQH